ncbi:transcriptional repressor NrdR [Alkalithermobacter thermoalcaliphilus JW-YL-7 = DSM 7308]|uniref:Transcriptional repressor NrdR n=1 Tax=Alkalithermobacter thermoalcaliphilus JW-YL-7 = DSM 7308 TaxID=1121328 RepID=A0A150FPL5_CLOPD|nr:transcriptional regulator, NrdR [[Clostridium] paradoxum JW-YL-7 = DSM 7308]SHK97987.1 transcriptional repressor NrdR [[Clostridium] paradoxum JW-YL-7 = DSM 7308]
MKCPFCNYLESKVIDSRPIDEGSCIRRRRECENCKKRFTTYEKLECINLMVIKKDGTRESFDRSKIINGIIKACEKRPVSMEQIEKIASYVEEAINKTVAREISSKKIGELIIEKLKDIDEIAYVRFASVYRQFKDISTFIEEIEKIFKEKR